jgi:hypothetical protein
MKQTTFAFLAFDHNKKQTLLEKFLAEMERARQWAALSPVTLRTRWRPVYRRHDLNTGFGSERENLSPDVKEHDEWLTP